MQSKVEQFEKELKSKIRKKADSYKQEEMLLLRNFKFFDYSSEGKVDFQSFVKVMERLSMNVLVKDNINDIFEYYKTKENDNLHNRNFSDNKLNYIRFVNKILKSDQNFSKSSNQNKSSELVSAEEFERALTDLRDGIRNFDLMNLLENCLLDSNEEVELKFLENQFLNEGLSFKYKVMINSVQLK